MNTLGSGLSTQLLSPDKRRRMTSKLIFPDTVKDTVGQTLTDAGFKGALSIGHGQSQLSLMTQRSLALTWSLALDFARERPTKW